MGKYLITVILLFASTVSAQEKSDTAYFLGLVNFNQKIAEYEGYLFKLEIEFKEVQHIVEELRKGRDAEEKSEREVFETVGLIQQLDSLHVRRFKALLIRYVDHAVALKDSSEGDQWEFCVTLVYNVRRELERYVRQQEAKAKKDKGR
jgi:hypothetical protein